MFRFADETLVEWKNKVNRKPLLVRGARQVGKSYTIGKFAKNHFEQCVIINFELEPSFMSCFETVDPSKILRAIELLRRETIIPGKTLLFLDEIQLCPKAILALRYFKELLPALHVIGAGSLLEFVFNDVEFQQPVGRVESLYMHPVSFKEYLFNSGEQRLIDYVGTLSVKDTVMTAIHDLLLERCKEYFILGGMPEVIHHYIQTKSYLGCEQIQASLLEYYRRDFAKYHKRLHTQALEKIFTKAPGLIAQRFKYVDIDPNIPARDQKPALEALVKAGIINLVYHSNANGMPIYNGINEKKFKILFLDLGLVQHALGLDTTILLDPSLILLNRGELAEQFVGQELLAYTKNYEPGKLFYWEREKKGSRAEIDYVMPFDAALYPIEVKAGKTGRLKSLFVYLEEKRTPLGIHISQNDLSFKNHVLSLPMTMIYELPRFIKEINALAEN